MSVFRKPPVSGADRHSLPARVRTVLAIAAEDHNVSIGMILSANKQRDVVMARREVCQVLRRMGYSLPKIGRILNRHHTTVLYAINKPVQTDPLKRHGEIPVPDLSGEWI